MDKGSQVIDGDNLEIWRNEDGSIFVTRNGSIGIQCGGEVYVKPLRDWHAVAKRLYEQEAKADTEASDAMLKKTLKR